MPQLTYRTAGESHGPALTIFVEGLPADLPVDLDLINAEPRTVQELNRTGSFMPEAKVYKAPPLPARGSTFEHTLPMGYDGKPGLYHLRGWVHTGYGTTLAANVAVEVR